MDLADSFLDNDKWVSVNGWGVIKKSVLDEGIKRKAFGWRGDILCITATSRLIATDEKDKPIKPYKLVDTSEAFKKFKEEVLDKQ